MRTRAAKARLLLLAACLLLLGTARGWCSTEPRLELQAPPSLARQAAALRALPPSSWEGVRSLVGIPAGGTPIQVRLVSEADPQAARTPRWITGFAVAEQDVVVLLPDRVLSYPHDSLDALLRHEVTHVLLARAAGGAPLPRWFQEGVAMLAARDWRLADGQHLLVGGMSGVPPSTADLERSFAGEGYAIDTAYAVAGALVAELVQRHGRESVLRIASGVAARRSFADAFAAATGEPLDRFEAGFWRRFRWLYRWLPFLSSGATAWLAVTGLALLAIVRRRQRDAELRRRWDAEDEIAAAPPS
jgi:hypothetical protein